MDEQALGRDLQAEGIAFIRAYNQCFYDRDVEALRRLYAARDFTQFWDNHAGCDSTRLQDHFERVATFFENGKTTESGTVEDLLIEDVQASATQDALVVTAVLRYGSAPRPGVRSTFVLFWETDGWKAVHIHHSFDPNEVG